MFTTPFLRLNARLARCGPILLFIGMLVLPASPGLRATPAQAAKQSDTPYLVKDIWPGNSSSEPYTLTNLNGAFYFQASDGVHGWELWKSDGTEAGTQIVKDINPGSGDSLYEKPMFVYKNTLFFGADDGNSGRELWKSDGTEAGTIRVMDIFPGIDDSLPEEFTIVGDTLYFSATDSRGRELWKSDGTDAGTVIVEDISPDSANPSFLANMNGALYFAANDGSTGMELWKSDGTPAGTTLVKDIYLNGQSWPRSFTYVHGTIFFAANDDSHGPSLWKTDGTPGGTVLVKDLMPGPGIPEGFGRFAALNDTLIFVVNLPTSGENNDQLWKSDGTEAGTVLVKDIKPGGDSWIDYVINFKGFLFFSADDGTNGFELWKTDGTTDGTVMVKNINPDTSMPHSSPAYLINVSGTLYFYAYEPTHGAELWKSDGTGAGTVLAADINPSGDSFPYGWPVLIGDKLFLSARGDSHGRELWAVPIAIPLKVFLPVIQ